MRPRAVVYVKHVLCFALLVSGLVLMPSGAWAVNLPTATQPPSGVAGTTIEYLVGGGYPAGPIPAADVTIHFANTCLGTDITTTTAKQVIHLLGSTYRVSFQIPASLGTGTYSVWVTGTNAALTPFTSSDCSSLMVTNTTPKLSGCVPSSSLAVSLGPNVTAYVPHGFWFGTTTGIGVVPIEGVGAPAVIATPNVVNACSSNSVTGQTVCTANNTDVYEIIGSTLNTTLTSGSNTFAGFSGGSCMNCGLAIDAGNNTAYIEEGFTGGASGNAIQALNLGTNTFSPPFALANAVSENISVDPNRNLILSPGEAGNYDVLQIAPNGALSEFGKFIGGTLDSAAEDCTTGIALSAIEFTNDVYVEDMTQAVFTPGAPAGTYTAPSNLVTLVTSYGFAAGTSGISEAPGASHLAVVTGEFGGNSFTVLQLPSTSGAGSPTIVDYANALIPSSAVCGGTFSAGFDPHTLTAFTSPNDGKAYALFAGYGFGTTPLCLARVDLAAILAATRGGGGLGAHDVAAVDFPAAAVTFYAVP